LPDLTSQTICIYQLTTKEASKCAVIILLESLGGPHTNGVHNNQQNSIHYTSRNDLSPAELAVSLAASSRHSAVQVTQIRPENDTYHILIQHAQYLRYASSFTCGMQVASTSLIPNPPQVQTHPLTLRWSSIISTLLH